MKQYVQRPRGKKEHGSFEDLEVQNIKRRLVGLWRLVGQIQQALVSMKVFRPIFMRQGATDIKQENDIIAFF